MENPLSSFADGLIFFTQDSEANLHPWIAKPREGFYFARSLPVYSKEQYTTKATYVGVAALEGYVFGLREEVKGKHWAIDLFRFDAC